MNKRDMIDMALQQPLEAKAADGADGAWRCNRDGFYRGYGFYWYRHE